jgi:1,4-dihydroxy-2-naphthoyl-CoA hydrolase
MSIWFASPTLETLNAMRADTMLAVLDITFIEIGADYLSASMPVTAHAVQPYRIMHGGASAALAETVASVASVLTLDTARQRSVGLALNINHLRAVPEGRTVIATARSQHLGRSTQIWTVESIDEQQRRVSLATLTVSVLEIERT